MGRHDRINVTDNVPASDTDSPVISTRRFFENTASVGISTGSKAAAYFIISLVLTRVLGTAALGVFTVALSSALLALRVAELGVGAIVVRDTARDPRRGAELLGSGLLVRLPGLAVMAATIAVVTTAIGYEGEERMLMWLLGGYVGLESLSRLFFSNAHGRMRMEEEAWITIPTSLFMTAGSVAVLLGEGGLVALGTVFVIGGLIQFIGALFLVSIRTPQWHREARWSTAGRIVRQSWPIGLAGLAAVIYYRVDTLMLAGLVGNTSAGEYSMAYNLLYGPNLLVWALMASVFPILSSSNVISDPVLRSRYRRLLATAAGIGAAFLLVIPISSIVLAILYGEAPHDAVISLQILLAAQFFTFVAAATATTLNATDAQRTNLAIVVVGVILNVSLNALIIPRYGAPGAATTTLVTEAVVAITGVTVLFRHGLRPFVVRSTDSDTPEDLA